MKELSNYINEKLDINNVKLNNSAPFPINGDVKKIKQFLIANGFSEIEDIGDFDFYVEKFNSMKTKAYSTNSSDVRFADTSYDIISKDNPIFTIDTDCRSVFTEADNWWQNRLSETEFLKKLKKRFDFKI